MPNTCTPPQTSGNNKLRVGLKAKNRLLLREAVDFYNKGLALKCSDNAINVALYNNKAHVNSLLGEDFGSCQHSSRKPKWFWMPCWPQLPRQLLKQVAPYSDTLIDA